MENNLGLVNNIKLLALNVNKYNDNVHLWLTRHTSFENSDIIFFSETKASYNVLETYFKQTKNYNYIINVHNPVKYHGVAMLINKKYKYEIIPIKLDIICRKDSIGDDSTKGRIICVKINGITSQSDMIIIGSYIPNSGRNDPIKLDYRIKIWDPVFGALLQDLKGKYNNVVWLGDINVAPEDIDVSNPKTMRNYAGFTTEEKSNFRSFITDEWYDIWRKQHVDEREYTWKGRSTNPNTRTGMRLDNIIISNNLVTKVVHSKIIECSVSDHNAVYTEIML